MVGKTLAVIVFLMLACLVLYMWGVNYLSEDGDKTDEDDFFGVDVLGSLHPDFSGKDFDLMDMVDED